MPLEKIDQSFASAVSRADNKTLEKICEKTVIQKANLQDLLTAIYSAPDHLEKTIPHPVEVVLKSRYQNKVPDMAHLAFIKNPAVLAHILRNGQTDVENISPTTIQSAIEVAIKKSSPNAAAPKQKERNLDTIKTLFDCAIFAPYRSTSAIFVKDSIAHDRKDIFDYFVTHPLLKKRIAPHIKVILDLALYADHREGQIVFSEKLIRNALASPYSTLPFPNDLCTLLAFEGIFEKLPDDIRCAFVANRNNEIMERFRANVPTLHARLEKIAIEKSLGEKLITTRSSPKRQI